VRKKRNNNYHAERVQHNNYHTERVKHNNNYHAGGINHNNKYCNDRNVATTMPYLLLLPSICERPPYHTIHHQHHTAPCQSQVL